MLDAVSAIVRAAGAFALSRWRGEFEHWHKVPGEVVSEIDLEVDRRLREELGRLDPDAGWLSEETVDTIDRLARRRVWIVDPIDGTRDFVRGRPGWCVSVALVEDGQPVIGVLDAPARDEHWRAERGRGATRNGTSIAASRRASMAGARVPVDVLPKAMRHLTAVAKPNSIALRAAMVAADEADLLASVRWGHEWDVAAVALIAAEAGAKVTDARGHPLRFNTPRADLLGILACAPGLHDAALADLRPAVTKALGERR